MKRGAIKAYREYLNGAYPVVEGNITHSYAKGTRGNLWPRKRPYGDYLYSQDREMFMIGLKDPQLDPAFDRTPWL
jgi:hypothetical protein